MDPFDVASTFFSQAVPLADAMRSQSAPAAPQSARASLDTAPEPQLPLREVNISIDDAKHTIYRFIDTRSGDLIQQVPPEELLKVMRNIAEFLQESQAKLNVTV
jgi:hypothetical protein